MRAFAAALALGIAAPALAQPAPTAPMAAAPSPEHLAAAERLAALFLPSGALETVFQSTPGMDWMLDMPMSDFPVPEQDSDSAAAADGRTFGEVMAERDPHFRERMRITTEVMRQEMSGIYREIEPDFRRAIARIYARRFTLGEIGEMTRFMETPTGLKFARESLTMMQDPEFMQAMMASMPRIMEAMPAVMERVRAATAHLPPEPGSAIAGDDTDEESEDSDD